MACNMAWKRAFARDAKCLGSWPQCLFKPFSAKLASARLQSAPLLCDTAG